MKYWQLIAIKFFWDMKRNDIFRDCILTNYIKLKKTWELIIFLLAINFAFCLLKFYFFAHFLNKLLKFFSFVDLFFKLTIKVFFISIVKLFSITSIVEIYHNFLIREKLLHFLLTIAILKDFVNMYIFIIWIDFRLVSQR